MTDGGRPRFSQIRTAADVGAVGLEMGIAVAIGCWLGLWIDEQYGTDPAGLLLGMGLGFGAAGKAIWRTVKKAKEQMENKPSSRDESQR